MVKPRKKMKAANAMRIGHGLRPSECRAVALCPTDEPFGWPTPFGRPVPFGSPGLAPKRIVPSAEKVGMTSKSWGGGGEGRAHSRVHASQGFGPAGGPILELRYRL